MRRDQRAERRWLSGMKGLGVDQVAWWGCGAESGVLRGMGQQLHHNSDHISKDFDCAGTPGVLWQFWQWEHERLGFYFMPFLLHVVSVGDCGGRLSCCQEVIYHWLGMIRKWCMWSFPCHLWDLLIFFLYLSQFWKPFSDMMDDRWQGICSSHRGR